MSWITQALPAFRARAKKNGSRERSGAGIDRARSVRYRARSRRRGGESTMVGGKKALGKSGAAFAGMVESHDRIGSGRSGGPASSFVPEPWACFSSSNPS